MEEDGKVSSIQNLIECKPLTHLLLSPFSEDHIIYSMTPSDEWRQVDFRPPVARKRAQGQERRRNARRRNGPRPVERIPFDGECEEFSVDISEEELQTLVGEHGDIRFH